MVGKKFQLVIQIIILLICVASFNIFEIFDVIHPHHNAYQPEWPEISKIFTKDTISNQTLLIVGNFVPLGYIILYSLFFKLQLKKSFWYCLTIGILGWALCFSSCNFITISIKFSVSRLRPCFVYICLPNATEVARIREEQMKEYGYTFAYDFPCTGPEHDVNEARRSFPSGHSSISAAMGGYVLLLCFRWGWNQWKDYVEKNEREQNSGDTVKLSGLAEEGYDLIPTQHENFVDLIPKLWKQTAFLFVVSSLLSSPIIFLSIFISGSRYYDNRHHLSDICTGYGIGLLCAGFGIWMFILKEDEEKNSCEKLKDSITY